MGIVFHKLCHHVLNSRTIRMKKQRQEQKKKNAKGNVITKLKAKRRAQLDSLVQEARIWMHAMSLPTMLVANYDKNIEDALDNLNNELMVALLGDMARKEKIEAVSGRFARNILVPGLENIDEESEKYYPDVPEQDKMRPFLDNKMVKASTLLEIYENCADFQQNHPIARTWREIRKVAGPYTYKGQPLKDLLSIWKREHTRMYLGLPKEVEWSYRMRDCMLAQLKSEKIPDPITDIVTFRDTDLIVVIPHPKNPANRAIAALLFPINVMKLYPRFFEEDNFKSLRDIHITDGMEFVDIFGCCVRFFLHEITHAKGVLETKDHTFRHVHREFDILNIPTMVQVPGRRRHFFAYGLEACLALARRDKTYDTNKAEDNADSWAFYFMLRMLTLVYPDLDILEAIRTEDLMAPRTRRIRRRSTLLHHCSLFQPLRHPAAGDITSHPDYDPSKDFFADPENPTPTTVENTLEYLKEFDHLYWED